MTRSRHPHHEVEPAAGGAAHNGPETEIIEISVGDGGGGGPAGSDSLRGPQSLLEAADHFSRPPFPAQPLRYDSIDTSGARS
jgi:hypothetical protein